MRRQTATDRALDTGAGSTRLPDPGHLPAVFQSYSPGQSENADAAISAEVRLDQTNVCINRSQQGETKSLIVPVAAYAGVMVQIQAADQAGAVVARLILKHVEPQFCVVLAETDRPELLATSWPAWASTLGLPMLVCDTGGAVKPIEAFSARPTATPYPRRKLALLTGRRPRFLVRRQSGAKTEHLQVFKGEREIIARN